MVINQNCSSVYLMPLNTHNLTESLYCMSGAGTVFLCPVGCDASLSCLSVVLSVWDIKLFAFAQCVASAALGRGPGCPLKGAVKPDRC